MHIVDLNCDMGESFGPYTIGNDVELMNYATSVNIACGFHGGDPRIMRQTVALALSKNVGIGAHPGLQDLIGFGRRDMDITPQEAYDLVVYQIGALYGVVKAEGGVMQHVKPHGALYNMAAKDPAIAKAVAEAVYKVNPDLILFALSGSELLKAGNKAGLKTASEVFADRTYCNDGTLTNRREKNALIHDSKKAIKQVTDMITKSTVQSIQGTTVDIQADTVCLHGDGENAVQFARTISTGLQSNDIKIQKISNFI